MKLDCATTVRNSPPLTPNHSRQNTRVEMPTITPGVSSGDTISA